MFASNFIVADSHLKHLRGKDTLHQFAQSTTITSGNLMTNHFCSKCGTLMYRVGSGLPGHSIMRLGTVDDFSLHASKLKPKVEQFVECRVEWLQEAKGIEQCKGSSF